MTREEMTANINYSNLIAESGAEYKKLQEQFLNNIEKLLDEKIKNVQIDVNHNVNTTLNCSNDIKLLNSRLEKMPHIPREINITNTTTHKYDIREKTLRFLVYYTIISIVTVAASISLAYYFYNTKQEYETNYKEKVKEIEVMNYWNGAKDMFDFVDDEETKKILLKNHPNLTEPKKKFNGKKIVNR